MLFKYNNKLKKLTYLTAYYLVCTFFHLWVLPGIVYINLWQISPSPWLTDELLPLGWQISPLPLWLTDQLLPLADRSASPPWLTDQLLPLRVDSRNVLISPTTPNTRQIRDSTLPRHIPAIYIRHTSVKLWHIKYIIIIFIFTRHCWIIWSWKHVNL